MATTYTDGVNGASAIDCGGTACTISNAASAGKVLVSDSASSLTWRQTPIIRDFLPTMLLNPVNSDWKVNSLAPLSANATNNAIHVRRFVNSSETGVGFSVFIPTGYTSITFGFVYAASATHTATQNAILKLYWRAIGDSTAVSGTWVGAGDGVVTLTALSCPNDVNPHYASQTVALSGFSPALVSNKMYQFELTRDGANGSDTLTVDFYLMDLIITIV